MAIGLVGSAAGGGLAIALWGKETQGIGIFSFIGAVLLVVAYRRFVQKRPLTGPQALAFPEKGIGIDRFQERRQKMEDMLRQAQSEQTRAHADSNLQKLQDRNCHRVQGNFICPPLPADQLIGWYRRWTAR